jgi:hypothetical protein
MQARDQSYVSRSTPPPADFRRPITGSLMPQAGHLADLVVISANPDGPRLGKSLGPETSTVMAQYPGPADRLHRRDAVVIEFQDRGSEGAGDHEPQNPLPDPRTLAAENRPASPGSRPHSRPAV